MTWRKRKKLIKKEFNNEVFVYKKHKLNMFWVHPRWFDEKVMCTNFEEHVPQTKHAIKFKNKYLTGGIYGRI